jgi:hypothetical protein
MDTKEAEFYCSVVKTDSISIEDSDCGFAISINENGKYNTVVLKQDDAVSFANAVLSKLEKAE